MARLSILAYAARTLGTTVGSTGGIGGECVDLVNEWNAEAFGLPHQYRNAVDWANSGIPGYRYVANAPANFPAVGDLVVWGEEPAIGTGVNGHIAIVLAADPMHLLTLDQNWGGRIVTIELHSYRGVRGWQHKG